MLWRGGPARGDGGADGGPEAEGRDEDQTGVRGGGCGRTEVRGEQGHLVGR